jgi:hypothetical protein
LYGVALQEAVCVGVGCSPREADAVIDLLDLDEEIGGLTRRAGDAPPWV